jgi:hypothetical protein
MRGGAAMLIAALLPFLGWGEHARAAEQTFNLAGVPFTLTDVSADVGVLYQSMRLNRAQNVWNVEISLTNRSGRVLAGPLIVSVESFTGTTGPLSPDGTAGNPALPFFDLSAATGDGALAAGERSATRTLALGLVTNAAPSLQTKVFAALPKPFPALAQTRTVDEFGQPVGSVTVAESGPAGTGTNQSDAAFGVVSLGQGAGANVFKFSSPEFVPVWRALTLATGAVNTLPNPRLTRRLPPTASLKPISGGEVVSRDGRIRVSFPPAAVAQDTVPVLTPLSPQALPALLPPGWSPLQAFWLEVSPAPALPATAQLTPLGPINPAETAALVRLDETTLGWDVLQLVPGNGANVVTVSLPTPGAYALVVGDAAPNAPPAPQPGQPLAPTALVPSQAAQLVAGGTVTPATSPASRVPELVTAIAEVVVTNLSGPLPSGTLLRCDLSDRYQLNDGTRRFPPAYENFLVAYQRPGDTNADTLHASFPLRPLLLFGADQLTEAVVHADVLAEDEFTGTVLDPTGGQIADGGVRVLAAPGALGGPQAARLRTLAPTNFTELAGSNFTVAAAFDLTISGVNAGQSLRPQSAGLATNTLFVLARVLSGSGLYGLEPRERLASDANGTLTSLEAPAGSRLPGLTGAGQYLLLQVNAPQALIEGTARNSAGQPAAGLAVQLAPWLTFSGTNGAYQLLGAAGTNIVSVTDAATGDSGDATAVIIDPQAIVVADPSAVPVGPRVTSVNPAAGATEVPRVTSVVVKFNKPISSGSALNGAQLLGSNGLPVVASLSLNLAGTELTLLPVNPLAASTPHTLLLATNLTDLNGRPLEGPNQFAFTTESDQLARLRVDLEIYEPVNGVAGMVGGVGLAEPDGPVILVNETTGETATVLARVDGSFSNSIAAGVDDFLSAVIVNRNGTRTTVPAKRQIFRDGRIGLFNGGGAVEATTPNGPMQVVIEAGAIETRTVIKLEALTPAQFGALVSNTPPAGGGTLVGGFNYTETGDPLKVAADVVFPVNTADLGLPANLPPEQATYVVVTPHNFGGTTVYEIVDRADFEPTGAGAGRIVTRSPPFVGLLAERLAQIRDNIGIPDLSAVVTQTQTEQNPHKGETGAFGILALPFSQGVTVGGRVVALPVDAAGNPSGAASPVAGALVRLEQEQTGVLASVFSAGELLAGADLNGNFGFVLRPSGAGNSFNLIATHPRFAFQRARAVGLTPPADATTALRVELRFAEVTAGGSVTGTEPPAVQVSHAPLLPAIGTGNNDGALVTVTAVDDGQVASPTLALVRVETPNRAPLELTNAVVTVVVPEQRTAPGRVSAQFRVRSAVPARVILKASAADDSGQQRQVDYTVVFGGLAVGTGPGDTNDVRGPRVIFSWPPQQAPAVPALTPILLRFNEPIPEGYLLPENLGWLSFDQTHFLRNIEASGDRREILVRYDGKTDNEVRLSIGSALTDSSQNPFDQNAAETGNQSFDLVFTQLAPREAPLTDSSAGGGAVLLGRYAYTLDRTAGRLLSYDVENPAEPELEDTLALDAFPTTLTPVPGFVLPAAIRFEGGQPKADGTRTNSFIAAFTGGAQDVKRLHLVPVEDGEFGDAQVGTLTVNPAAQIVKSKWDPPFMGYFELGADVTSISLLNLTAFDIKTRPAFDALTLPALGTAGVDADNNGSFCETNDVLPLPSRRGDEPPGLAFSYAPLDPQERIQDFDFDSSLGLVVATHMPVGSGGVGNLRVVLAATSAQSLSNALVPFPAGLRPKRVVLLPAVPLQSSNSFVIQDIALVSLTPDGGGDGRLAVVDVSNPAAPTNRNTILLPNGEGSAGSIVRRTDGLLGLATSASVLLLDPAKLLLPGPVGATHPAFVGRVELPAGGVRDFVTEAAGLNVIFSGGNRRIVQTAPRFQVVRFNQIVNPSAVATQSVNSVNSLLRNAIPVNLAEVTKVDFGSNAPPAMDPERHYYVIVDAPGGAGDELPLVLAAVDSRGQPQRDLDRGLVPVIVGDEQVAGALLSVRVTRVVRAVIKAVKSVGNTLTSDLPISTQLQQLLNSAPTNIKRLRTAVGELEKIFGLFPKRFRAVRLSENPDHPLYNRYLAGPFMILGGAPREEEVKALLQQWADFESGAPDTSLGQDDGLNRAYLRPSPRLWVGLPSLPDTEIPIIGVQVPGLGDPVLKPFHSEFRLHPTLNFSGVSVPLVNDLVDSLAADTVILAPLALTLLDNLPIVNGQIQPTILPGAHQLVRVNFAERPLVFVPGFAGSLIEVEGDEFWLALIKIYDRDREELLMKSDGTPAFDSRARDALRYTVNLPVFGGLGSIYGTWLDHLASEVGYVEYDYLNPPPGQVFTGNLFERRRRLDQEPNLNQYPLPNLFVFPYDWRRDNQHSANLLKEYVRIVREMHPDADGIDLVGHSNGGLVSRAYMLLPAQRQLVRRFISVGTPWLGAPKILAGLKTGDVNEHSLNVMLPVPAMQAMLQFAPAAHQLLPTKEYFDLGFRPLVEDGFDINANRVSHEFYNFNQYMSALENDFLRKPLRQLESNLTLHPVKANHLGFFAAQPVSDHRNEPAGAEFHHIFGFGAVPDTIGQVRVVGRLIPAENTTNVTLELPASQLFESEQESSQRLTSGNPGDGFVPITTNRFRLNEEVEVRFVCGDGTVPIGSLTRGFGSSLNLNAPQARVYPLIGAADEITGHNPMLNTPAFLDLFDSVLAGRRMEELNVSVSVAGTPTEGSTATVNLQAGNGAGIGTDLVDFVIDYGDGGSEYRRALSGSALALQHRYRQSGTYLFSVGVASDTGISGFTSRQVVVSNAPPQVTIQGGNVTLNLGETRIFIADVTDPGVEDTHTFRWEGPDVAVNAGRQFAMPMTFNEPGDQIVKVTATDSDGATNSATVTVTVLATPPTGPPNPPIPRAEPAPVARLDAFEGGQPELFVRVNGHAPGLFGTTGISSRNETITLLSTAADAVFDPLVTLLGLAGVQQSAPIIYNQLVLPLVARFLGVMAKDAEYVRFVRSPPPADFLGVVPTQLAQVAAASAGRPIEVDMLYLEGGVAKFLHRYLVAPPTNAGVRLTFDWTALTPKLEVVAPGSTGSLLDGIIVSNVPSRFDAFGEQKAADRQGPVVVGVGNPFNGRVELFARDNFTAGTNIIQVLAWDSNGDGRLDDEIYYEVPTNVVERARLPSRPFVIAGADEHGNVGDVTGFCPVFTGDFRFGEQPGDTNTYENRLTAIRTAVRGAINDTMGTAAVRRYLVGTNSTWFLEQGSGAGLWKSDPVAACNGLYRPGFSDNDYEVYFPVHLRSNFTFTAADRAGFLSMNPYAAATMTGDWYFTRPEPADAAGVPLPSTTGAVAWRYEVPAPFTNQLGQSFFLVDILPAGSDPALGYPDPLTPAEAVTRQLVHAVTNDSARRALLRDINFFPERREHFMFGALHLQRPPAFGDDPIGDSGTGRQMLLLKWALEGAFVTATDGGPVDTFSPGAPPLADVYGNWMQFGVPQAEGAEWAFFQEWAALMAKPLLDTRTRYSLAGVTELDRCLDDAISVEQKKKVKKLGKAAIRGALARLAGDPEFNGLLTNITFTAYQSRNLRSFEDFILKTIQESGKADEIFGDFARARDNLTEGPDLRDFLRAKNGDENYLSTVVFTPGAYQRFVFGVFEFLRSIQTATVPAYQQYILDRRQQGAVEEVGQRITNLRAVLEGGPARPGLRDLSSNPESERFSFFAAAANYSDSTAGTITLNLTLPPPPSPRPESLAGKTENAGNGASAAQPVDSTVLDAREHDTLEGAAVDFTLTGGVSSEVKTEVDGAPVTELSPVDNEAVISGEPVPVPPNPTTFLNELTIWFREGPAGPSQLLDDWPAAGNRPRSPRYLLTGRSQIDFFLIGATNLGTIQASVRNVTRGQNFTVQLSDPVGAGFYTVSSPPGFIPVTNNPSATTALYVKDEDLIEFAVQGTPGFTVSVMVDAGEIATGGLSFANRSLGPEPRPTVHANFTTTRAFFSAGDQQFADDIQGNGNLGQVFAEQFGSGSAESGEGDFLYLLSHGFPDGTLRNHSAPLGGGTWLNPFDYSVLADQGIHFWTNDAEVAVLHACFTLNTNTDFSSAPANVQSALINRGFSLQSVTPGASEWRKVMTNSPRPIRMVLAFDNIVSQRVVPEFNLFSDLANSQMPLVEAWSTAFDLRPWAVLVFSNNLGARLRELPPRPLGSDPVLYLRSGDPFPDPPDEEELFSTARRTNYQEPLTTAAWVAPVSLPVSITLQPLRPTTAGQWKPVGTGDDSFWLARLPAMDGLALTNRAAATAFIRQVVERNASSGLPWRLDTLSPIYASWLMGDTVKDEGQAGCSVVLRQAFCDVPLSGSRATGVLQRHLNSTVLLRGYELIARAPAQAPAPDTQVRDTAAAAGWSGAGTPSLEWMAACEFDARQPADVFWPVWSFDGTSKQSAEAKKHAVHVHAISGQLLEEAK